MTKDEMISYLKGKTYYTDESLRKIPDYKLYAMYTRIRDSILKYRKELKDYFASHPEVAISDNILNSLKYNELSDLRKKYKSSRKKVVQVEETYEDMLKTAQELFKEKTTTEVVKDIITSDPEDKEMFIYEDEIEEMGYVDYSDEELKRKGVIPIRHKR